MAGNTIKMKDLPSSESSRVTDLIGLDTQGQSVKLPNKQNELETEVANIGSKVGELEEIGIILNPQQIIEVIEFEDGRYINAEGSLTAYSARYMSKQSIPVSEGDEVVFVGGTASSNLCVAGYSSEENNADTFVTALVGGGIHPEETKVVIPKGVTHIAVSAFKESYSSYVEGTKCDVIRFGESWKTATDKALVRIKTAVDEVESEATELQKKCEQIEEESTELANNVKILSEKLVKSIDTEEVLQADLSRPKTLVNCDTGEYSSTTSTGRYASEIHLDGAETKIIQSATWGFSGRFGCAFLKDDDSFVVGYKHGGGENVEYDAASAIAKGATKFRTTTSNATTLTIFKHNYIDVIDGLEKSIKYIPNIQSSAIGGLVGKVTGQIASGESIVLTDYPKGNKKNDCYQFSCSVDNFNAIKLKKGNTVLTIDNTNITIGAETYTHNLVISRFINVNVYVKIDGKAVVSIDSVDGDYTGEVTWGKNTYGELSVENVESVLSDCTLCANNKDFKCPIWYFGASWEGNEKTRVFGQLDALGYYKFLANAWSGRTASQLVEDFKKALKYGTPRILVAILANVTMDNESIYERNFDELKNLCKDKNIELIVRTHPNTNTNYTARNEWIRQQGVRIVDYFKAMNDPNKSYSSTEPDYDNYDGYIDSTGSHPTARGAKAIAMRVLADVPEIMML